MISDDLNDDLNLQWIFHCNVGSTTIFSPLSHEKNTRNPESPKLVNLLTTNFT